MFKASLRGIQHSVDNLQAYIDQYGYRFNRSQMKGEIFDNLLTKMVAINHALTFSSVFIKCLLQMSF